MAAPNDNPGNFLLEVADIGLKLNETFTTFITYRKVHDRQLENLYATLNITTGCLTELGTTLNKHKDDFSMKEDVTRSVAETCKSNFETLLTLVTEGITEGGAWKAAGTIGGQSIAAEVDPWLLITMSVGGREEAKTYWKSIDDTRDALVELSHLVKYMILKSIEDKATLTSEQENDLKKLRNLLPHIIQNRENVEKSLKAEAELKAREEEEQKKWEERRNRPGLCRVDSIANSDITLAEDIRRVPPPVIIKERDFDTRSVSSWSSSDSGSDVATEEIYEEWILRWNEPIRDVTRSWGFLGLKFKNYYENRGFWGTDPEFRTVKEMKEAETLFSADKSSAKAKEAICKVLQALPNEGGIAVDHLLDERTEASSHEDAKREWSIVAVKPKQKFPYGAGNKKWGKDPKYTDWLITIKGVTVDTQDRSRNFRRDDPWRKHNRNSSYNRRYRSRSPIGRHHSGRRDYIDIRPRDRSPFRPLPVMRNPVRTPLPMRERGEIYIADGYVQGKVVVGKIMTKKEAEDKMIGIWDDMITKAAEKKEEVQKKNEPVEAEVKTE